jgi:hypothetical protein
VTTRRGGPENLPATEQKARKGLATTERMEPWNRQLHTRPTQGAGTWNKPPKQGRAELIEKAEAQSSKMLVRLKLNDTIRIAGQPMQSQILLQATDKLERRSGFTVKYTPISFLNCLSCRKTTWSGKVISPGHTQI